MRAIKNFNNRLSCLKAIIYIILGVMLLTIGETDVFGQSGTYEVQVKDRLKISFWEYPELNSTVEVDREGRIDLPIVGKITAAGLAINVLREKIISQMSQYNKLVTQISIEVVEFGSNTVYVTGQVRNPGKYSFEEIPNLWEILLEAGGPLESANLDNLAIVRAKEDGKIYTVDLAEALRNAKISELPEIYAGDTIQISGTTTTGGIASPLIKQDFIYIFGAIARQGAHRLEPGNNLLEVIGRAGGYSGNANLKEVKHISVTHGNASIAVINLNDYLNKTTPVPMPIGPGDTIIIPRKSWLGGYLGRAAVTTTVSVVLTSTIFLLIRSR